MQRDVKIGMSVVYQQGEGDSPMAPNGRKHPALVTHVHSDYSVGVVIFPFNTFSQDYRYKVPRGKLESTEACWYCPEEG